MIGGKKKKKKNKKYWNDFSTQREQSPSVLELRN
jgi:hypothetical protein